MFGWLGPGREGDVKINIICPATEVHIRKVGVTIFFWIADCLNFQLQYTKQEQLIVRETPELYDKIVKPYIDAFPASRTQW
jgi:m7GpppX diphosphatase